MECIAIVRTDWYNKREKANNMFYKQIILNRGLPFEVKLPTAKPVNVAELTEAELNAELEKGYADMTAGQLDRLEER